MQDIINLGRRAALREKSGSNAGDYSTPAGKAQGALLQMVRAGEMSLFIRIEEKPLFKYVLAVASGGECGRYFLKKNPWL